MTRLAEITARVMVALPAGQAWAALTDWGGQHRWMLLTRVHGGHGAGARVVARTGAGPVGFTDTMIITEWEPPRRCVVQHTGRVVRGLGIFEVSAAGPGSEVRWTERLQLPFGRAGLLGWRAIRPLVQRGMDTSLHRFARLVSASHPG